MLCWIWAAGSCHTAHARDRIIPIQIDAIATFMPGEPDLRLGGGLVLKDSETSRWRLDLVNHCSGLTWAHKVRKVFGRDAKPFELTAGLSLFYSFPDHHIIPGVTVGRIVF